MNGLSRATTIGPHDAEYWRRLGLLRLYEETDRTEALADFQHAIRLNTREADSWIGIAFACQLLGNAGEERNAIERALQVEPKRPEIAWQAANLYAALGDQKLMFRELCVAVQHDSSHADAARDLAYRSAGLKTIDCPKERNRN